MKILPTFTNLISEVKTYYAGKHAKINQYYTDDKVVDALNLLKPVEDVFESYAKHKGVFVVLDKASTMVENENLINPELKKALGNSIMVKVEDGLSGSAKTSIIDVTKPYYKHVAKNVVILPDGEGKMKDGLILSQYEDNFIRTVYRTVENLVKLLKK